MNSQAYVSGRHWPLTHRVLLIMKLAIVISLWAVLQATASSHAQTISLHAQNITLADAMRSIQQQSGFPFFLNGKTLATSRIAIDVENVPLDQALDRLLSPLSLEWVLKNETIVIKPRAPLSVRSPRNTQQKATSGNVKDVENGRASCRERG